MKFSVNLAQKYSNVDIKNIPHDVLLERIGVQLGAIENVVDWKPKYSGVVVVKVVSCEKHPDADKLTVCLVDDGGRTEGVERNKDGLVQVVCGAPNVRADMFVAWIAPGVSVPATRDSEPFVLEVRELRGKISNGMLASPKELDISDEHEGILVIDEQEIGRKAVAGEAFSNLYNLDDLVVDLENKMFTHRPDCFGNLGVARELAGISGLSYKSPDWYTAHQEFPILEKETMQVDVSNPIPELVPRFTVVAMDNVAVTPSRVWLRAVLKRVGIKSVNNVVDVTNYVMHLTGQPLHAFDYDKLLKFSKQPSLQPRMAKKGEKLVLLNDKEIELTEEDMVIATDTTPVALAGVMGGADTEVDESTTRILIECANFDMYAVRRSSMRHGLFTDAVTRFNKGQSPLQNAAVLAYAMKNMNEQSGAEQASQVFDVTSFDDSVDNLNKVETSVDFINDRLGSNLTADDIKNLLENVEFVVGVQGASLHVTAPFWRMDISIAEDIVEEVGRLYGYNKLPVELPQRRSKPAPKNALREFKMQLRNNLRMMGANEVLTYSFVHGDLLRNTGIDPDAWAYHLRNALSPDLQYYRTSLTPSLLAKIHKNIKAQAGSDNNLFALFEIGKAHIKDVFEESGAELPKQMERLGFVVAGDSKVSKKTEHSPYYVAKKYVDELTNKQAKFVPLETNDYPMTSPYQIGRSAAVTVGSEEKVIGVVGEYNARTRKALKLPEFCAGFELDIEMLKENVRSSEYASLSNFPSSTQDITFEVASDVAWSSLFDFIQADIHVRASANDMSYTIEPLDIYHEEDSDKKRVSFRMSFAHHHKTLKTDEISTLLDGLTEVVGEKLQAVRV